MSESGSETGSITPRTDTILPPTKNMKQFKLQLATDGTLSEKTVIYESDFNIIMRYDVYDEEEVDEIESHLVIQHTKKSAQQNILDIYFYDKSKTKEYRYWILFSTIESIQNEIDHEKSYSNLKLVFDHGKEYNLKNCPIEMVSWLSQFLLSL